MRSQNSTYSYLSIRTRNSQIFYFVRSRKTDVFKRLCYAHTNRFCIVQENIKTEVLKVQTELARSIHYDRGLHIFLHNTKPVSMSFIT